MGWLAVEEDGEVGTGALDSSLVETKILKMMEKSAVLVLLDHGGDRQGEDRS